MFGPETNTNEQRFLVQFLDVLFHTKVAQTFCDILGFWEKSILKGNCYGSFWDPFWHFFKKIGLLFIPKIGLLFIPKIGHNEPVNVVPQNPNYVIAE